MPARKRKPESKRDCLLRSLLDADVSSPKAFGNWILALPGELLDEWERFRKEPLNSRAIQCVHDNPDTPSNKDFFIALMHQHAWLKAERGRLRQLVPTRLIQGVDER